MLVNINPFWHYAKDLNGAKTHASQETISINTKKGTYINILQCLSDVHLSFYSSVHENSGSHTLFFESLARFSSKFGPFLAPLILDSRLLFLDSVQLKGCSALGALLHTTTRRSRVFGHSYTRERSRAPRTRARAPPPFHYGKESLGKFTFLKLISHWFWWSPNP